MSPDVSFISHSSRMFIGAFHPCSSFPVYKSQFIKSAPWNILSTVYKINRLLLWTINRRWCFTWCVLLFRNSSGQLRGRTDKRRPRDDVASLQILVHRLCSVQRLSGCRWRRDRRLRTIVWDISLRHCSRLSLKFTVSLPHWSRREWEK